MLVGNLRSEILVVQSAQNRHRQRETDSLDGTRDRRVLVQPAGMQISIQYSRAVLTQDARQSLRTISESLSFWKDDRDAPRVST